MSVSTSWFAEILTPVDEKHLDTTEINFGMKAEKWATFHSI